MTIHLISFIPTSTRGSKTNLDIVSYSAADKPASKENRSLALSAPFEGCAVRFPVLRFLGMSRSAGGDWPRRPLSAFVVCSSAPAERDQIRLE